jgi:hypothetical protein
MSGILAAYGWIACGSGPPRWPDRRVVVEEATFSLYAISDALQRGAVNQIKSNSVRNLFREIGGELHKMWIPSRDTVTGVAAFHFNRRMGGCATLEFLEWREGHVPQSDTAAERSLVG